MRDDDDFVSYTRVDAIGRTQTHRSIGYKGPWGKVHMNKSFLNTLREEFGEQTFTNANAYVVYGEHHAKDNDPSDNWMQMTVRNTLCKAAYLGILVREGPGVYRFEKEGYNPPPFAY